MQDDSLTEEANGDKPHAPGERGGYRPAARTAPVDSREAGQPMR